MGRSNMLFFVTSLRQKDHEALMIPSHKRRMLLLSTPSSTYLLLLSASANDREVRPINVRNEHAFVTGMHVGQLQECIISWHV